MPAVSLRARLVAPAILLAAACLGWIDGRARDSDLEYFARAGRTLLSGSWAHAFAEQGLQAGPLQLAFCGFAARGADVLDVSPMRVLALGLEPALLALLLLVAAPRRPGAQLAVGGIALALGLAHSAVLDGHPAEIAIPLVWVLAARDARAGRMLGAGLLVGLSGGLELWGLLGVAVLALAPSLRRALVGTALAAGTLGALLAPFVLGGDFHMFAYRWPISEGTPLSLVAQVGTPFTWELRLAQAATAVFAAGALARAARGSAHAVWAVPAVVVAVRLLLDPVWNPWYWLALQTLGLAGLATLLADRRALDVVKA